MTKHKKGYPLESPIAKNDMGVCWLYEADNTCDKPFEDKNSDLNKWDDDGGRLDGAIVVNKLPG